MRKLLIVMLILTVGQLVFAEQEIELTIDKAIEFAVKNNRNYMISKEEVKQFKQRVRQNFGFLPQATVDGIKNIDEKLMEIEIPSFIPGGESTKAKLDFTLNYEFTFQVIQPIFAGGKILYSYKNAKIDLKIAREKQQNAKEEVILNVKKIFFNVLVMRELLKAHREALKLAETNYININENYKLGMVSKYDLLRAELTAASIKPNILKVKKYLDISLLNLKFMTGIPEESIIHVAGELQYNRHKLELAELINSSLANRSEILQLEMEKQKAANLLKIAYGNFLPTISVVSRFSYRSNNFNFKGSNWEDYYSINLGISYPIFTGFKRSAQVGEIKVMRKILDLSYKELSDATKLQVRDLVMTIREEYENIQTGLKNIETAKEGVRIAELTYNEGLISILELNASYNDLTVAKVNFFQAVYNYNIALAQLEKISGIKL
ncbi:MAG: TolC family protein [Candidatus Aminicenantes bacterium]|nr:TolC family protein [Candidatus Aminicenantes bacterium]